MKIFEHKNSSWDSKHNFLDDNGVGVGFDTDQQCCENADWFISDKIETKMPEPLPKETELDGYNFDTTFIKEDNPLSSVDGSYDKLDGGGMVVFKLTKGDKSKYLHLFNCHNGYYSHNWTIEIGGQKTKEGCI